MIKLIRNFKLNGILILLCLIMFFVTFYAIDFRMNVTSTGKEVGDNLGKAAGIAVGSFQGMTKGAAEGTKAGKTTGLSANDTESEIKNQIQQLENLEVLVASVKLSDYHEIGKDAKQYAALYLGKGNIVFSVDMSNAEVISEGGELIITVPKPQGNLYIENDTIIKVAEYQRKFFNGSAKDGFEAYLNTMKKMHEVSEETLANYDSLKSSAEKAAENQISLLAKSASSDNDKSIKVYFKE